MDKKEQTTETYRKSAEAMAKKFRDIGARVADIERGFALAKKSNPRVLEIGCGDGRDAKVILERTDDYLGIDISPELLAFAKEHAPNGRFTVADLETFDFPKQFDIIFSFASLLHTPRETLKTVLARIYDALAPGGVLYVSTKTADTYQEITKTDEFGTRTYYHYPIEDFRSLTNGSFEVAYQDFQDFLNQRWFTLALRKPDMV